MKVRAPEVQANGGDAKRESVHRASHIAPRKRLRDRSNFTPTERAELWRRWRTGQSLSEIGRALETRHSAIRYFLEPYGGIAPIPRKRNQRALSVSDREEISRGIASGESFRCIALRIKRPTSTVSREVHRNGGREGYRASDAEAASSIRARRPKQCKLALLGRLRRVVAFKLSKNWSPEQIQGWLRLRFPHDSDMRISHETIYRSLFIQARGVLKKELQRHLRSRRTLRRGRSAGKMGVNYKPTIPDAVSIRERPAEAEDRAVPGHWEGDLLEGKRNTFIATLVERTSRFTILVRVSSRETEVVIPAIKKQIAKLPGNLRRSLTWDRGRELAAHKELTIATDLAVFFCDPRSPWQRGTNENTNGLLRQYFPKGTDLTQYTQQHLTSVARELNMRPRETLGFRTPAETIESMLH